MSNINTSGSIWRKWDLHIHTASSFDYKYKSNDSDVLLAKIWKDNEISAVAITDHWTIDKNRILHLRELANDITIFPGFEMRTDKGASNIHIIAIFPETTDLQVLSDDFDAILIRGKEKQGENDENIYRDFGDIIDFTKKHCGLLSVHAGRKDNGIDKEITNSLPVNIAIKKEISDYIDIFEVGSIKDISDYQDHVFKSIAQKPLIKGSDNHNPNQYTVDEFTWIKADTTFEGLKQILYEPQNRVHIGEEQPEVNRENCINSISISDKSWFPQKTIYFNKGIVSIIGARGSGKTALLDLIAVGVNSYLPYNASFLQKAGKKLQPLSVQVEIDGKVGANSFPCEIALDSLKVRYLSQQFVETLCLNDGSSEKLIQEIESFIFTNIDSVNRHGSTSFSELREILCGSLDIKINTLQERIKAYSREITHIHNQQSVELPQKRQTRNKTDIDIQALQQKLPKLDKTEQFHLLTLFDELNSEKIKLVNDLKVLRSQEKALKDVYAEITDLNKTIFDKNITFKKVLVENGIQVEVLKNIDIQYPASLLSSIEKTIVSIKNNFQVQYGEKVNPVEKTYNWYLQQIEIIDKQKSAFSEKEKHYYTLSEQIKRLQETLSEIDAQVKQIEALDISSVTNMRVTSYQEIFCLYKDKISLLESLYTPLVAKLLLRETQQSKLGFMVKMKIDLDGWIKRGESLLDLRKAQDYRDHNLFIQQASELMYDAWISCDSAKVAQAITNFFNSHGKKMSRYLAEGVTLNNLADWIFSTEHIDISYEITFEGVPIEQLSPGTKGVVLMLLFLGVDTEDTRPLLIDQPEDNLDPESVYNILVPYFIKAKQRRQIIMVTHNPNLVVGTDSDQVIIASAQKNTPTKLPILSYQSGGLENPLIVEKVCSILEGGEHAFKKRESRYHFH